MFISYKIMRYSRQHDYLQVKPILYILKYDQVLSSCRAQKSCLTVDYYSIKSWKGMSLMGIVQMFQSTFQIVQSAELMW